MFSITTCFLQGDKKIRWLGEEALVRYLKLKPSSFVPNRKEVIHDIRKTAGGAILDPGVLNDPLFYTYRTQGSMAGI